MMADLPKNDSYILAESINESRQKWRIAFFVFWAATVLGWAIVLKFVSGTGPELTPGIILFSTLIFNCAMLGAWGGLGNFAGRWIIFPVGTLAFALISGSATGGSNALEFITFCCGIASVVCVTTFILRMRKGEMQTLAANGVSSDGLQFGINDIFIWTTAVAILLGVGRVVIQWSDAWDRLSNDNVFVMIASMAITISLAVVISIWALLGQQISAWKWTTLIFSTVFAMFLLGLMGQDLLFPLSLLVTQILCLAALLMLRKQGLRFLKRSVSD